MSAPTGPYWFSHTWRECDPAILYAVGVGNRELAYVPQPSGVGYGTNADRIRAEVQKEAHDTARLLAAAPELLGLVREAFRDPDSEILGTAWNHYAAEVLARVEGK